jgi:hypothetical protein
MEFAVRRIKVASWEVSALLVNLGCGWEYVVSRLRNHYRQNGLQKDCVFFGILACWHGDIA